MAEASSLYLMEVRLGPVQSFIQQARKTRDVWFGSQVLCTLSRKIAQTIITPPDNQLIVPAPRHPTDLDDPEFPVSNVVLALVRTPPRDVAQQLRTTVDAWVDAAWQDVLTRITLDAAAEQTASAQLRQCFTLRWAAVPLADPLRNYQVARWQLEQALRARKHTDDFAPITWQPIAAIGKKSSLDGSYEAVYDAEQASKRGKRGEYLSGIDLLKRFGRLHDTNGDNNHEETPETFPSTSHMAAKAFFKRLKNIADRTSPTMMKAAWERYTSALPASVTRDAHLPKGSPDHPIFGTYDGSLLFRERLVEDLDPHRDAQVIKEVNGRLSEFLRAASNDSGPQPYYAILQADGDHMGDLLRLQSTPDEHRLVAQALQDFARKVRKLVEDPDCAGELIYAGGDDLLAFLPLYSALKCANALQQAFQSSMAPFGALTLSVGIAVVHHLEPLGDALERARMAEQVAKRSRNALAVVLNKRSGAERIVCGSWADDPATGTSLYTRLTAFTEYHASEQLPDGYAYELQRLTQRLPPAMAHTAPAFNLPNQNQPLTEREVWAGLRIIEAQRILKRKRTPKGLAVPDSVRRCIEPLIDPLNLWLRDPERPAAEDDQPEPAYTLDDLAIELIVARTFARMERELDPLRPQPAEVTHD